MDQPVVKFRGFQVHERKIADLKKRQDKTQDQLSKAQSDGNKTAQANFEKRLAKQQEALAAQQSALASFVVYSKKAGNFEPMVEQGTRVTEGQLLARIVGEQVNKATFKTDRKLVVGDEVSLGKKSDPQAPQIACTVDELGSGEVTVECVGGMTAGTEVTLAPPSP